MRQVENYEFFEVDLPQLTEMKFGTVDEDSDNFLASIIVVDSLFQ